MRIKAKAAQGMTAVILVFSIVAVIFFINLVIKKSLEAESPSGPAPLISSDRHGPVLDRDIPAAENFIVAAAPNHAAVSSKTGQKIGKVPDKEIIYEPSIKGNLLIQ